MRLLILSLALLFCLFPYTQIFKFESYTQPYALVLSTAGVAAAFPYLVRNFPRMDALMLALLAAFGIAAFMITCLPSPSPQEFKYLLIYISPLIFALASFAMVNEYPVIADRIIVAAAVVWIGVGLVQTLVDPTFATQFVGGFSDAAGVVVDSGRGTLGLAPEPTHFGFHMVVLATMLALVGGRNLLSLACLFTAVAIARSSSALLALMLGSLIYVAFYTKRARLALLLIFPAYFLLGALISSQALPEDVRIFALVKEFYNDPLYLITSDGSTNARLGGIYVGLKQIFAQTFLPAGLAHETWTAQIGPIMSNNPWLLMLSDSGIPSGILIVIFQLGLLGLVPLFFILRRMMTGLHSHYETLLVSGIVFVFFSQYMLSTPGFGLIYGILLARAAHFTRVREQAELRFAPLPPAVLPEAPTLAAAG